MPGKPAGPDTALPRKQCQRLLAAQGSGAAEGRCCETLSPEHRSSLSSGCLRGGPGWLCTGLLRKGSSCTLSCFQVSQEQESSSRALEQLHQEASGQGHALAQVCREKELLGREKAALEGRLAAMECHQQDLSKQLAETR